MEINRKTRIQLKVQSGLFVLLFIVFISLLGWLSTQYKFSIDLTSNQRNSLSEPTLRLIKSIANPVTVTAFISPNNDLKTTLDTLFQRYHDAQNLITYRSINPDTAPDKLREYNIQRDGEVVIEIEGRKENLSAVDESSITNTLARLQRKKTRWIVFLYGHGERNPYGDANFDFEQFNARLVQKGFRIQTLNLVDSTGVPDNTDLLVIADTPTAYLSGERNMIDEYIDKGGNLLWLTEPTTGDILQNLADKLELEFLPGVVVDPSSQLLGLDRVDFALAADYTRHAITTSVDAVTLYPTARAIEFSGIENSEWEAVPLMLTHERTWNETGEMSGEITNGDNDGEQDGPLTLGMSLTRNLQTEDGKSLTQRVVVTGDTDFLANQFLGNGNNLALGLNMVNWLSHDDNLIAISPKSAIDTQLALSQNSQIFIAAVFLFLLPVGLIAIGLRIWLVRRKR